MWITSKLSPNVTLEIAKNNTKKTTNNNKNINNTPALGFL